MNDEDAMDRAEAERYPCPYVAPAAHRKAQPAPCGAKVGEHCRVPGTSIVLRGQPAHRARLVLAGVAAASTVSRAHPA